MEQELHRLRFIPFDVLDELFHDKAEVPVITFFEVERVCFDLVGNLDQDFLES